LLFFTAPTSALSSGQHLSSGCVVGPFSQVLIRPEREADNPPPSSSKLWWFLIKHGEWHLVSVLLRSWMLLIVFIANDILIQGTTIQVGMSRVRFPVRTLYSSIYLILPATLGPGVYSDSNKNEYQRQKNVLGSRAWPVRRTDNLTAICEAFV
jgi:hypothetical protein